METSWLGFLLIKTYGGNLCQAHLLSTKEPAGEKGKEESKHPKSQRSFQNSVKLDTFPEMTVCNLFLNNQYIHNPFPGI